MSHRPHAYILPLLLLLIPPSSAQHCYFPDGTYADGMVPCNATGSGLSDSACCSSNSGNPDICTTTGLCFGHIGNVNRGACTDKSFKPESCATVCVNAKEDYSSTYSNIIWCYDKGYWCCAGTDFTGSCCDDDSLYVDNLDLGYYFALPRDGSSSSAPSATGSAPAQRSTHASSTSSDSGSDLGTTVGAAVGVPLGILVVGLLAWLFWRERRKSRNAEQESQHTGSMHPLVGMNGGTFEKRSDVGAVNGENAYYGEQNERYQSWQRGITTHELPNRNEIQELSH